MLRVRDEIKMTINAYQTLYQSSVTFAMRKQLQAENGKDDLIKRVAELEVKKKKAEAKSAELKARKDLLENRNKARAEIEATKREEEIKYLKYQEANLSKYLKMVSDGKA